MSDQKCITYPTRRFEKLFTDFMAGDHFSSGPTFLRSVPATWRTPLPMGPGEQPEDVTLERFQVQTSSSHVREYEKS